MNSILNTAVMNRMEINKTKEEKNRNTVFGFGIIGVKYLLNKTRYLGDNLIFNFIYCPIALTIFGICMFCCCFLLNCGNCLQLLDESVFNFVY